MRFPSAFLLLGLSGLTLCAASSPDPTKAANTLPASALQPYGRSRLHQQRLELISSAAHVGFSFEGTECQLFASLPSGQGHNYLQYELDGVYQHRLKVLGAAPTPLVIMAPRAGRHTVWVYKATEAHTGPIALEKVTGRALKALPNPKLPLIEFIGNSITCGAAADPSEVPCGSADYHDQHNAYLAYGPRVARALHTNFILSSVSGIGIYRNWNSEGPSMSQVYEKLDFQETNPVHWNFATYSPRVVSIALGTNDLSAGDGKTPRLPFDSARYVTTYLSFIKLVKAKYPQARLALLSSPMASGKNRVLLQHCLTAVQQGTNAAYPTAKPVATYFFQPMQARGCSGHPSVEDHAILAKELEPFFQQLLR